MSQISLRGGQQDILDGIAKVRVAFMAVNLKPPTTMLLESYEEGMRFLAGLTAVVGSPELGRPMEMADGSVWMEVQVMGIAVRWPANRIATPDGSWSYA